MIKSFRCAETEKLFNLQRSRDFGDNMARVALRKLKMIDAAETLEDLAKFPGNHLEKLKGDRDGQYSIRVNDRNRACFRWQGRDVYDLEIVDYH